MIDAVVVASARSRICFVGLGGNLGDAAAAVTRAFGALDGLPGSRLLKASRLYRTPAWGITTQPDFINAVAMLETTLPATSLLEALLDIECEAGRDRQADGSDRWGPRTLDLDLLLYGDEVIEQPGLCVPHPHLHQRAFALLPLVEIAPDMVIPGIGAAGAVLATMATDDIQALG